MRDAEHEAPPISGFITLAIFVLVVGILRIAQAVMVPLALAAMLAFLLSPLVVRLNRWGLRNVWSVVCATVFAFGVIGTVGWIISTQALDAAQQLPSYEGNINAKIDRYKAHQGSPIYTELMNMVGRFEKKLMAPEATVPGMSAPRQRAPVAVEVEPLSQSRLGIMKEIAMPVLGPLGTAFIVVIFMIAILLQREDLRDRFIKVVSPTRLNLATQAVDDAAQRVSRYLGLQLVINSCYGVFVGLGLLLIGIPNALLWGLLATLLRFIPFVGPWAAAACPLVLALAIDPGWMKMVYTLGLYIAAEVVTANIIEVRFYGESTGISGIALMVAAVFWTWLWGIAGLFLCTPLTVCVLVLGRHIPGLKFLSVLIGNRPVLQPPERLYHRMLEMNYDEMYELADKFIAERSLGEFYEEVFVPALILAEEDRHAGTLAEKRQTFISKSSRELIEELERRAEHPDKSAKKSEQRAGPPAPAEGLCVLGIPARDDADEVVALMVRHLLRLAGIGAEVSPITASPAETIARIERDGVRVAYVSALPPSALGAARQATRRLKERCALLKVVVGVWAPEAGLGMLKERLGREAPDEITTHLLEAVKQIERLARTAQSQGQAAPGPEEPPAAPGAGARKLAMGGVEPTDLFDAVTRDLAQIFEVPLGLVAIVASDRNYWKAYARAAAGPAADSEPTTITIFEHGPKGSELLVVEDITKDARFEDSRLLKDRGVRFYAFVPLRARDGQIVGSLCVLDTKPRPADEAIRSLLQSRATELMEMVETRYAGAAPS